MTEMRVRKPGFEFRICPSSWVTLLRAPAPFTLGTTFPHSVSEPSLVSLHWPSLSLAHQFLNSVWRSSWWFGPINSPGLGPLAKSLSQLAEDLKHFSISPLPLFLSPHTYLTKSNAFEAKSGPEFTQMSSVLSEYFPCPQLFTYTSLSCSSLIMGSSKERSLLFCHSP